MGSLKKTFFSSRSSFSTKSETYTCCLYTATKDPKQDLATEGLVFIEGLWWIYKEKSRNEKGKI